MKSKFLFLMPRLLGLTVIVGLASLVLGLVFKLLLGLVVIGSVAFAIATIARKARSRHIQKRDIQFLPNNQHDFFTPQQNRYSKTAQRTIVPIN